MFVPLTDDRGERIYVNMTRVECIMPFDAQRFQSHETRCRSQVCCTTAHYRVRETVEEVLALVSAGEKTP
jgi:hypothetical protein